MAICTPMALGEPRARGRMGRAMVPISIVTGWIYSVAFISAVSIYANFVSTLGGCRADEPLERDLRPGSHAASKH
ncbi:MAG: hypothetical protein ACJ740_09645 [Gaiellales bacterium]